MKKSQVSFARGLRRKQTDTERNLWSRLRNGHLAEIKFRRQEPIGKYIADFVSFDKKLIIEIDGSQHTEETVKRADEQRTLWLESQGFRVIRFWDNDVLLNLDGVLTQIEETLK
ncbi:MAG: endonuclease domain-containing protein [Chloroflexota bacterium]